MVHTALTVVVLAFLFDAHYLIAAWPSAAIASIAAILLLLLIAVVVHGIAGGQHPQEAVGPTTAVHLRRRREHGGSGRGLGVQGVTGGRPIPRPGCLRSDHVNEYRVRPARAVVTLLLLVKLLEVLLFHNDVQFCCCGSGACGGRTGIGGAGGRRRVVVVG